MLRPDLSAPDFWWQGTLSPTARLLSPIGSVYGWLTARRMSQAPKGRASVPVLCIGNLVIGGAGKTPTALAFAHSLASLGQKPGVLLRGYGGTEKGPLLVRNSHSVEQVGDEALLYAKVATTVVSADRVAGAEFLDNAGIDIILMDDGFQNPSLHKDLSIVVADAQTGWGNGKCCPAGPLRAPEAKQLKHASAIIALGDGERKGEIEQSANQAGIPLFYGKIIPDQMPENFGGKRFVAYSGIGRPEKFFASLKNADLDVQETIAFPDHHVFTEADAVKILSRCRSLDAIPMTTEKDFVRLLAAPDGSYAAELRMATQVLKIQIEWESPENIVEMLRDLMAGSCSRDEQRA